MQTRRSLRHSSSQNHIQALVLGRRSTDFSGARLSSHRATVLLKEHIMKQSLFAIPLLAAAALQSACAAPQTGVDALLKATTNAGYPSSLKK